MNVAIIGAGFSGCHLYKNLSQKQFRVTIFDKSRGCGGRLSTKYIGDKFIDHGTSSINIHDKELIDFLDKKVKQNILQKSDNNYIPTNGINKLCSSMIDKKDLINNTRIIKAHYKNKKWFLFDEKGKMYQSYDLLLLTNPATQILEMDLNLNNEIKDLLKDVKYTPISTLICYDKNSNDLDLSSLEKNTNFKKVVDNSSKYQYKDFKSFVLHLNEEFTQKNIDLPKEKLFEKIYSLIKKEVNIDIKNKFETIEHLWKYAFVENTINKEYIFDTNQNLGICGDYFQKKNLEGSFYSSNKLSEKIINLIKE